MARWGLVVTSDRVKEHPEQDETTPMLRRLLGEHGHELVYTAIAGNDPVEILYHIAAALREGAEIVLVTGGTGPNPRDISADLVSRICDRVLPGVGEEFRRRSLEEGVANAVLSRALACSFRDRLLAVSPGSPGAARLMAELLLEVGDHAIHQLRGHRHEHHKHYTHNHGRTCRH
ncbi:MAG TPA: molybdenum cofactor biosynthesis protein MoaB [Pyrodictium sp.]|nr:molybdenum cofactor biosynthesis protein MoaB [Pyrodictium sp.]